MYHSSWLASCVHEQVWRRRANLHTVSISLNTQHPHQPGKPRQNAGGNTGILYSQWCQRSKEVIRSTLTDNVYHLRPNPHPTNTVLILEHFTTAKLVMTTSRTRNGSRSVAANDVSSCVFILPCSFTCSFVISDPTFWSVCVITPHIISLHGPLSSFCVVKKRNEYFYGGSLFNFHILHYASTISCLYCKYGFSHLWLSSFFVCKSQFFPELSFYALGHFEN